MLIEASSPPSRLQQFVRWVLFLPGLWLTWMLLSLFMAVFPPDAPWWLPGDVAKASLAALATFPVVFALAPRGKAVAGWCFYIFMIGLSAIGLLVVILEALGVNLPWSTTAGMTFWQRTEWRELGKAVAWLFFGTASFQYSLKKHREASPRKPPANVATTTGRQFAELSIYFRALPEDPVWKIITDQNVGDYQHWFIQARREAKLDQYFTVNSMPPEADEALARVSGEALDADHINPHHLLLLALQYVQADTIMRQMYATRWLAMMVKRSDFAPQPEALASYIQSTFFSQERPAPQPA